MHLNTFHTENKLLQTKNIFSPTEGSVISINMKANAELKEHITETPAFLIGISGEVIFDNEKGEKQTVGQGDFIEIEPFIKHWLIANQDSQLILIK